jgi:hypothetical protein
MQLKLRRSQRATNFSGTAIFCLDAMASFAPSEKSSIDRYRLGAVVIYNSEASRRLLDHGRAQNDGTAAGALKSLATVALASTKLNITIAGLERGQHVECKSLDELLAAEDAIMEACRNLQSYLRAAATFDGREILFDFSVGEPTAVASAPAALAPGISDGLPPVGVPIVPEGPPPSAPGVPASGPPPGVPPDPPRALIVASAAERSVESAHRAVDPPSAASPKAASAETGTSGGNVTGGVGLGLGGLTEGQFGALPLVGIIFGALFLFAVLSNLVHQQ